jgi:hypothetical protein
MAKAARTIDLAEALELSTSLHEAVIVERDGRALAAVVPIELYEKLTSSASDATDLFDDLAAIGAAVPEAVLEKLPKDGASNVDKYLYGKRG